MARSNYGAVLGWGLLIGAVAGAFSLFRDKAKASSLPTGARAPAAKGPKQKFAPGDEVTVTGGPTGADRTFIVRAATLTPAGWQYDLGEGAPMPQGALHFVSSAADRAATDPATAPSPALVKAAPVATMTFPPEVVTRSPESLARDAAARAAKAAAAKATKTQGGPNMTARQQRITDLLGLVRAEKDATKLEALKAELVKLAKEEKAALVATPATPQPTYPVGLVAKFGKREATITGARPDGKGSWIYTVDLKSGEFLNLGSGTYTKTEAEVRDALASELGPLALGQAYPRGISVFRRGKGGVIVAVSAPGASGEYVYSLQGWPNPVSQNELGSILRQA